MKITIKEDTTTKMHIIYKLSLPELEMKKPLDLLLRHEFTRQIISPWGSPVLFNTKKDGLLRMCVKYRTVNKKTVKIHVPFFQTDKLWDQLENPKYFTTLDFRSGYNQIIIEEEDIPKTAFRTRQGQFEYLVSPFGITGAFGCFQTLMNTTFRPFWTSS